MAYRAFDTNFVATALACFFNQSGYTQKLHGGFIKIIGFLIFDDLVLNNLSAKFWNQNTQLRYTPRGVTFSSFKFRPQITAAFERYTAIMLQYQEKYPALLASLALTRVRALF
jgi:hypothetical protein